MLIIIVLAVLVVIITTPFVWWYFVLQKYKSSNVIPGPRPKLVVGNTLDVGTTPQALFKNCFKFLNQYGPVYKIYLGNELRIFITNPEIMQAILSSNVHITKSNAYDLLRPWLGDGLLTSTGLKWKTRRKMITPTFHFTILKEFLEVFNSCGDTLVHKLSTEVGKGSFDIYPYVNLCSLDVICETAMGVKILAQTDHSNDYVKAVSGFLEITIVRGFSFWKRFDFLFKLSPLHKIHQQYLKKLHSFTKSIIRRRREEISHKQKESQEASKSEDGTRRKVALLDMLLECEDNNLLSDKDIAEEIDTFIFEGHDTSTSGIAFALLALAENREVQEQVYKEIVAITEEEQNITMQHLHKMKYLEMVVKEVQRIYPSVPMVERQLAADWTIGGYTFPKDSFLTAYIYGIHHSEECFPDPERFDPNRFLPENQSKRHTYAYVPFSAGPRNCIGQKFALLEMKVIIIKILKNFRILPVRGFKADLGMAGILKSYNGIYVCLLHRQAVQNI